LEGSGLLESLKEIAEDVSMIAGVWAEILLEHLPNPERYRYVNQLELYSAGKDAETVCRGPTPCMNKGLKFPKNGKAKVLLQR
jgi:hypothetical protein